MKLNISSILGTFFIVISITNAISHEGVTVTKDGELVGLVQSELEAAAIFSKPRALKFDHKIKSICAGGYKTVVLTEDGLVFEWGLGAGTEGKQWTPLGEDKKVISIACGDYHTLALTENGEIYSWGKDAISLGQNELKNKKRNTYIPKKVAGELEDKVVSKIFAGFLHNIAIADGDAYSWGDADHGQTAHSTLTTPLPKRINVPGKRIKEACCGGHHSLLLTEDGELYSVGSGSFGKLGTGSLEDTDTLSLIPLNGSKVLELACGGDHSMILLENHDVYTWGWNEFGQLGTNDTLNRHFPTKINFPENVTISHLSVGKYAHSMAISGAFVSICNVVDEKKAYVWGYNDFGQLGTGDLASRYLPTEIGAWNVTRIEGGYKHTLILRNSGELEAFGESVYGQLGEFS